MFEKRKPESFDYMLLSRLKQDCIFFLNNGQGLEKYLWSGSVEKQIQKMRELWKICKPDWLTLKQIKDFERLMLKKRNK